MTKSLPDGRKTWDLSRENFAKLLAALDPDPGRGGERYEQLRERLVALFSWRGSAICEELADEALNRLARKIDEGEAIRNLSGYAGGIARLVWLESLKKQDRNQEALDVLRAASGPVFNTDSTRLECFESCLEGLPQENRALILDYYREEKAAKIQLRKQLAAKLGVPLNTIRIRAHRIRLQLETCVRDCQLND